MITTISFDALTGKLKLDKNGLKVKTETFSLSRENIDNKTIVLSHVPAESKDITFLPEEGIAQRAGIEFDLMSNIITWNGLGLDGFLEVGDVINVTYYYY